MKELLDIFNPVFWVFTSYGFGMLGAYLLKYIGIYWRFKNHNYISDTLTKNLGILQLAYLIKHSFLAKFNPKINYKGGLNTARLRILRDEMTFAEVAHLVAFVFLQLLIGLFLFLDVKLWYIIAYTISNIMGNLYLVFLQQYNKRRIDRILAKNKIVANAK